MHIRVEGLVSSPVQFTFADLATLPEQVESVAPLVAGREGAAVPLRALLRRAGLEAGAAYLTVESGDGSFAASVPLEAVGEALVVYALGGLPLPSEKGGPFRLLIPDAARCGGAEVDKCANVKSVAILRLEAAAGRDTRPSTRREHLEMHKKPGHAHSR